MKSFVLNAAGFTCVTFLTGSVAYYATTYFTHGINRWQAHIIVTSLHRHMTS